MVYDTCDMEERESELQLLGSVQNSRRGGWIFRGPPFSDHAQGIHVQDL